MVCVSNACPLVLDDFHNRVLDVVHIFVLPEFIFCVVADLCIKCDV